MCNPKKYSGAARKRVTHTAAVKLRDKSNQEQEQKHKVLRNDEEDAHEEHEEQGEQE